MGKQNKNNFDCQGGDFSLKSLDDSFDAEDGGEERKEEKEKEKEGKKYAGK